MFLGVGSYTWPWAAETSRKKGKQNAYALQMLQQAAMNGIRFLQFGDNMPLHELTETEQKDLKSAADEKKIAIQAGTRGLTVANIERYLPIASFFQSPFIRMVIDDVGYEPAQDDVTRIIRQALPALTKSGIVLAIENHDRFPAAMLKEIIDNTSDKMIGICLDTANSLGAGEGVQQVVNTLAPYTVNLHLKDLTIKRVPSKMGFVVEGIAAGEGILDIPWIINKLGNAGRCTTAILELWINETGNLESTLLREQQWADTSIQYLKKYLS